LTWYSETGPLTRLAGKVTGIADDVTRVRRAWHWDGPRPHTWPERGEAAVDLFTCGEAGHARTAVRALAVALGAERTRIEEKLRGVDGSQ